MYKSLHPFKIVLHLYNPFSDQDILVQSNAVRIFAP